MNKMDYLSRLETLLKKQVSKKEVNDIIRDYAEYFEEGRRLNKSDEEISAGLGTPENVATELLGENNMSSQEFADTIKKGVSKGRQSISGLGKFFKAILIILLLIIFVPLGGALLLGLVVFLGAVIVAIFSLLLVPFFLAIASFIGLVASSMSFGFISTSIGIFSLAISICIGALCIFSTAIIFMIVGYIWNITFKSIRWIGRFIKSFDHSEKEESINE